MQVLTGWTAGASPGDTAWVEQMGLCLGGALSAVLSFAARDMRAAGASCGARGGCSTGRSFRRILGLAHKVSVLNPRFLFIGKKQRLG